MENKRSIMFDYIGQWRQTNLTKKRFAEEHQISVYSFKYWCKLYEQSCSFSLEGPKFIEVKPTKVVVEKVKQVQIELTLPNGLQIKIY